tara:strand:- start:1078 stop:1398 length:321 start_codon:yes stop_codon:yes gene_type:complete
MPKYRWTDDKIIEEILDLKPQHRYSTYVKSVNGALWKAAERHFGSWGDAIKAAGLNYDDILRWGPRIAPNRGKGGLCHHGDCTNVHHANGLCQKHYNRARYHKTKT